MAKHKLSATYKDRIFHYVPLDYLSSTGHPMRSIMGSLTVKQSKK